MQQQQIYFETQPSSAASWNVCVKPRACATLNRTFPPMISIAGNVMSVDVSFTIFGFEPCPIFAHTRIVLPPVAGPELTLRYSSRFTETSPNVPFVFQQELSAGVLAVVPVPAFNLVGSMLLVGLAGLFGFLAVRRS
jgi:hypothetical protein